MGTLVFACIATIVIAFTTSPKTPKTLSQAVARLEGSVELGTSDEFKKALKHRDMMTTLVAPASIRKLLTSWDALTIAGRGVTSQAVYDFVDGRVELTWRLSLSVEGTEEAVYNGFVDRLKSYGFEESGGRPLETSVKLSYERAAASKHFNSRRTKAFQRRTATGIEEIFAEDFASRFDTSRQVVCGTTLTWTAAVPFEGATPTFRELWDALPGFKPTYWEKAVYERLGDEPATQYHTNFRGDHWHVEVPASAQKDVEALLPQLGYKLSRTETYQKLPYPPYRASEAQLRWWSRDRDSTSSSVMILKTMPRLWFSQQAPQSPNRVVK
jgi:hypothetical protein